MEHLREFGLTRDPFVNDPVQNFYYESPVHRAAEKRLLRAVAQHKGLCLLQGEPGSGKSMLARRILDQLEEEAYEASLLVIVKSGVDAAWLLSRIASRLGVSEPGDDALQLLAQIYDRLSVFAEEGRRPVVLIDDAHLLGGREVMESLRALLDLEYEDHHLLTLVLVGQSLDGVVALDPGLPHRLEVRVTLDALDVPTAAAYLAHRLTTAGGPPTLIGAESVEAIQRWGAGLPRRMNTVADNALYEAHLDNRTHVTTDDVELAARDLGYSAMELDSLADGLHAAAASPPGGTPIDLTQEVEQQTEWDGSSEPLFEGDDELKEPEEAPVFESPATVVMEESGGVDDEVEDLFDNLIEE